MIENGRFTNVTILANKRKTDIKMPTAAPKNLFKDQKSWNSWQWQMANAITDSEQLQSVIPLSRQEKISIDASLRHFRMAITPYYASLIDPADPFCPIRLQAVPQSAEGVVAPGEYEDPLQEDQYMPVPGLVHRYPDRALFLVTQVCFIYCRHCTRRRRVGEKDSNSSQTSFQKAVGYIKANPVIRDVLVSGGDPLVLSDEKLETILSGLREIEHVEIIRIGTRAPVVMPMRITTKLAKMIQKYHPVYLNTHFNHPREITALAGEACAKLANHGIPLGNQAVLLRYVNDCSHVMKKLSQELLRIRVRPYYISQCDPVQGLSHFRTPVSRGIEIIEALLGHTSGMAVPTFVVDLPGGCGKVPIMPNYTVSQSPGQVVFRNFEGCFSRYTENINPDSGCGRHSACQDPRYRIQVGPSSMLDTGGPVNIIPDIERIKWVNKKPND